MSQGENADGRSGVVTGWGNTGTGRTMRVTAHAVRAAQASNRLAICGVPVFDVDLNHPWVVRDAADSTGCRRCTAALAT